jgi:hypothetical protein
MTLSIWLLLVGAVQLLAAAVLADIDRGQDLP